MKPEWILFFSTDKYYEAEILKGLLENNQIPVLMLNRQDSSYPCVGDIEMYVPRHLYSLSAGLLGNTLAN